MLGWRSHRMNELTPAPTVTARYSGSSVRMTALIVPRGAGMPRGAVTLVSSKVSGGTGTVLVRIGRQLHRIRFAATSASSRAVRSPRGTP